MSKRLCRKSLGTAANDPKIVASFVSKFNYWNDDDVVPVMDIGEAVQIAQSSLAWARSSSKG